MRKLVIMIIAVMIYSLLAKGFDVRYERISSEEMKLNFTVNNFKIVEVIEGGVTYSKINYDGSILTNEKGYAALPRFTASVQLKDDKDVDLKYSGKNYVEYKLDYPLLPSRGVISRSENPSEIPYEIASESIKDVWYPEQIAENINPFIMRDVRGTTVIVHPFQYNSVTQTLRVYKQLSITLTDNTEKPSNPLVRRTKSIDSEMSGMYNSLFLNYNETKAMDIGEFGELLIVYTSQNGGLAALNPYIQWKEEMGYTVNLLEVSNGTDLDATDDIQTQYNANPNILYVQLVGDWANIKSKLDNSVTSTIGSQDPMLGCVVGSDQYMDIMVGRFSVQSSTDVATQINKAINYEKNPDIGGAWYDTALGMARLEGAGGGDDGEADDQHQEYVRNRLLSPSFNYTTVHREYDGGSTYVPSNATSATISAVINSGVSILNYINHGDWTGWSVGNFDENDVTALTNGDKLPFVISVACLVGKTSYSSGDCFAETWLKKSGGGAVVGMFSSISQPWIPPMSGQDYFNDVLIGGYDYNSNPGSGIIINEQRTRFGSIACNATNLMLEENPIDAATKDTQEAWNIFGDVTLQVRTDQPILIDNADTTVLPGNYSTTITAGGSPVEGARVTLYQNGTNVTGLTDASGNVSLNHSFSVGTNVTLTVTGYNLETEQSVQLVTGDIGGTFALDTTNLDYGAISIGYDSVKQFVISNSHASEIITGDITTIAGYIVSGVAKGNMKDMKNTMSYTVQPGENKTFNLTFAPTTGGSHNGNITITSSDTNHATENIAVTGTGIVPDINLNPTSLTASANIGTSVIKTFDIENTDLGTLDYSMSVNYTSGKEIKASGGPDTYGYSWKDSDEADGPIYNWVEINGIGTHSGLSGLDQNMPNIGIGFNFNFYGNTYNTINICTNGWISFTSNSVIYENTAIPNPTDPNNIIAPFWDDLDVSDPFSLGNVYYYYDDTNERFIIEWDRIVQYGSPEPNSFQIILYKYGKIVFQYKDMQGDKSSCTIGLENIDASDGNLVNYNSEYLKNNLAIEFKAIPRWLSLDSNTGSIIGVGSDMIAATCDATDLEVGVYTADIMIASNDADEATEVLPITFTVTLEGVYVDNLIEDRTYSPNDNEIIDISNVFADAEGDPITLTIESNSDPAVVDASLVGSTLTLSTSSLLHGTSTIVLKGEDIAHGESATHSFDVTIDANQPSIVWDFESGLQDWTIGGTATSWQYYNAKGIPSSGSKFLFIDSDTQESGVNVKGNAISPIVDLSAYSSGEARIGFRYYFNIYFPDCEFQLRYTTNGGTSWIVITDFLHNENWDDIIEMVIPDGALTATTQFGFWYNDLDNWEWYAGVDDVYISVPTELDSPVAAFSTNNEAVNTGGVVTFTDASSNSPSSWSWSFSGGTPSTSTDQNPVVTYNTVGTYDVTLIATNAFGSDDEIKTGYITVSDVGNMALSFDGANEYVSIPDHADFNFGTSIDYSIELWAQSGNASQSDPSIIGDKDWNSGSNKGWVLAQSGSSFIFNLGDGSNRADFTFQPSGGIVAGSWYHIVLTIQRGGDVIAYINGTEVGRRGLSGVTGDIYSGLGIKLAQDGTGSYSYYFNGLIDEVRIWNDVRTPTEIVDNQYTIEDPASEANLIAYYQFDEQSGAILPVIKGANNGTLISMEDEDWVVADYYTYSVAPSVPANIVTSISGSDLVIDWDDSANATGYDVYSSDNPYGGFSKVTSVVPSTYSVPADQAKLFYYIVAKN